MLWSAYVKCLTATMCVQCIYLENEARDPEVPVGNAFWVLIASSQELVLPPKLSLPEGKELHADQCVHNNVLGRYMYIRISYINVHTVCVCLCVSVCVCPLRDLRNGMSYCCTSFINAKRFSWWVAQTAFQAYKTRSSRGKVFGTFCPVYMLKAVHAHYTSGYRGQEESCPPLEHCWKVMHWRTRPPHHGYHSWYCFLRERVADICKV